MKTLIKAFSAVLIVSYTIIVVAIALPLAKYLLAQLKRELISAYQSIRMYIRTKSSVRDGVIHPEVVR